MKIILMGAGASGKDFFVSYCKEIKNIQEARIFVTRPKRTNDTSNYVFVDKINPDEVFYTFQVRGKDWKYGYSNEDLLSLKMNASFGIDAFDKATKLLLDSSYADYVLIYFKISEEVRKERMLQRGDADSVERRLKTDREDYENFEEKYNPSIVVEDPNFKPSEIYNKALSYFK